MKPQQPPGIWHWSGVSSIIHRVEDLVGAGGFREYVRKIGGPDEWLKVVAVPF